MINERNVLEFNKHVSSYVDPFFKDYFSNMDLLSTFIYIKLISPTERLYLSNNEKWVRFYIENKLYNDQFHEKNVIYSANGNRHAFWGGYESDKVFDACKYHGMVDGFIIFDENDIFSFSIPRNKSSFINDCLRGANQFEEFTHYIKSKLKDFIKLNFNMGIIRTNLGKPFSQNPRAENNLQQFKNSSKYFIKDDETYLTSREFECTALSVHGKTLKEIAFLLKISPKTVEVHLDKVKEKLNCYSKSELIEKALKSKLKYLIYNFKSK